LLLGSLKIVWFLRDFWQPEKPIGKKGCLNRRKTKQTAKLSQGQNPLQAALLICIEREC
jgi:hypothetical protein